MYYFAYGSNLNRKQMLEHNPESTPKFIATLPNYKLVFGGWSRQWRGGVATIKPFRGERVPGGVYELTEEELRQLDKFEARYNRIKIKVTNEHGELIEVYTYVKTGRLEETEPSKEYLAAMRQGYKDWEIE